MADIGLKKKNIYIPYSRKERKGETFVSFWNCHLHTSFLTAVSNNSLVVAMLGTRADFTAVIRLHVVDGSVSLSAWPNGQVMCLLSLTTSRSWIRFPSGALRRINLTGHELQYIQLFASTETFCANPVATTRNTAQAFHSSCIWFTRLDVHDYDIVVLWCCHSIHGWNEVLSCSNVQV